MNPVSSCLAAQPLLIVRLCVPGLLLLLVGAAPPRAEGPVAESGKKTPGVAEVSIAQIEVGLAGHYKVGEWTPLWVTLQSAADLQVRVIVNVSDSDDNVTSCVGRVVPLPAGTATRIETRFRTGRLSGELLVEVADEEGKLLASRRLRPGTDSSVDLPPAIKLDLPLWITLGNIDLFAAGQGVEIDRNLREARLETLERLPTDWRAMQSVDLLILPTGRRAGGGASLLTELSPARNELLRNWVQMGGHLLVSVGSEAALWRESPLAAWIPVIEGEMALRQLSSFESYAGRAAPLKFSGTIPAARLAPLPRNNVVIRDLGSSQALVADIPYGFGRVTVVALDLDAELLSNWPLLKTVVYKLTGAAASAKPATRKTNRQLTHVGVTELATQLQQTHEAFATVRRPSYWWVMGLILLYIVVIGPLDYFLVQRVFRRPELTWLTFLLFVAAGVFLGRWNANRTNGQNLQVNQFDLVDMDAASGTVRANTWVSVYAPEHRRFSIAIEPRPPFSGSPSDPKSKPAPAEIALSWMAPPENSVGGLYRTGSANLGGRTYRFDAGGNLVENLPVPQWSTASVSAAWESHAASPPAASQLKSFGPGQLNGSLTQNLDLPLEDCLLVVDGWAYIPTTADATLKPGVEWQLKGDGGSRPRELKALLTQEKRTRRSTEDAKTTEILATTEAYNPLGRNRGQQVAMVTFYEAAGGHDYTGLTNAALRGLELTDLMQRGRAVLIGRLAASPTDVLIDGVSVEPSARSTWVRLVLPVQQVERVLDKTLPKASDL